MSETRPVIYLDVDGVLLRFPEPEQFANRDEFARHYMANPGGGPADGVREFLEWATTHCDVRWLTAWGSCGDIGDEGRAILARRLRIPVALLEPIHNPLRWDMRFDGGGKCTGIDWDEHRAGREWVWIDDEAIDNEQHFLRANNATQHFLQCDTSKHPNALRQALAMLQARFAAAPPAPPPR